MIDLIMLKAEKLNLKGVGQLHLGFWELWEGQGL